MKLLLFKSAFFKALKPRENEAREGTPVPHDNYLKFIISSYPSCEGYFYCCSHVNNLKLHDVILTDQWGVALKITMQLVWPNQK